MATLEGKPASPGVASGRVKIVRGLEDLYQLNEGDIIVAETIAPEMSPILLKIKGIIVEEGGLLEHACIMAREFHIPCIVDVEKCTEILKDGEVIEINGQLGTITKKTIETNQPQIGNI